MAACGGVRQQIPRPQMPFENVVVSLASQEHPRRLGSLVSPEGFKAVGGQVRIAHSVLDIAMTEVVLDSSSVVSLVGELEAPGAKALLLSL